MLETLRNAFKVKEIRNGILFTLFMLVIIRIGCLLPLPGVSTGLVSNFFGDLDAEGLGFLNSITGGSLEKMALFALSITPYITSSIIMQLLTIAIPKLEELQKDGEEGRKVITKITRFVTIALALIEAGAMAYAFYKSNYLVEKNVLNVILVIVGLTAGSAVLMWIGERITEKGVGNGISIVLVINIVSRMPSDFKKLWEQFIAGKTVAKGVLAGIIILAIIIAMILFVVLLQGAERRVPIQYSKKIQGRKQVGGQSRDMPIKVNTSGVIPIIFAQSLLQTPVIIANLANKGQGTGIGSKILKGMTQSNWCNPDEPIYSIGLIVYILLVIGFAFFYTQITFNPLEIANNLKRSGGFIPGIRPGKPTSDYLNSILNHIVLIGAIGLIIVAVVPIVCSGFFGAEVTFLGTSLIIVVGVVIETLKQIESRMRVRYYKGFLND